MPPRRTDRPRAARLLLLLALALLAPLAQASEFAVREAEAHLTDGVYRLDARLSLSLNAGVEEALNNGVPITISVDIEVLETYPWLPDQTVASLEQRYLLRHHALSERYLVNVITSYSIHYTKLYDRLCTLTMSPRRMWVSRLPMVACWGEMAMSMEPLSTRST